MQRLGKNQGRYHGETIDIDSVLQRVHTAAAAAGWQSEIFHQSPGKTLRCYHRVTPHARRNIYFSTGIHGDEPAGPLAIAKLLEEDNWPSRLNLWLNPCLNQGGFRLNTREDEHGLDLNRDYRNPRSPEVRAHIEWLQRQPDFDWTVLLHEDWEANGFYVYELNPDKRASLADPLIQAMQPRFPIEHANLVDAWECVDGIIRPQVRPGDRPQWAEAIWLIANKSPQSYTLETPSDFPIDYRVQMHLAAVRTLLEHCSRDMEEGTSKASAPLDPAHSPR